MADRKITELTAMSAGTQATGDLLTIVDVSEAAAVDKNKKITVESLFKGIPSNVGIGNSNPGDYLSVARDLVVGNHSGAHGITIAAQSNNTGYLSWADGTSTTAEQQGGRIAYSHADSSMRFNIAATERMRIDSSGRLLVGTSSAGSTGGGSIIAGDQTATTGAVGFGIKYVTNQTLNVFGSMRSTGNTLIGYGVRSSSSAANTFVSTADNSAFSRGALQVGQDLIFSNAAGQSTSVGSTVTMAERLRIDSSGNLMMGTSSSPYVLTADELNLSVGNATDHATIQLYSGNNKWGAISFNDNATNASNAGFIGYYHPDNYMVFNTNSAERMRIDSSGNVGIGLATNIGATLHVDPSTNVTTGFGTPLIKVGGANSWGGTGSLYSIGLGYNNGSTVKSPAEIGFKTTSSTGLTSGDLIFATRFVTTDTAPTERMRIDRSGKLLVGASSGRATSTVNWLAQIEGGSLTGLGITSNANSTAGAYLSLAKSRGTTIGSSTIVNNNDLVGAILFSGADGTDANSQAAGIQCNIDGPPGANDMPGRLIFSTTADGASSSTERMRIDRSGNVNIVNLAGSGIRNVNCGSAGNLTISTSDERLKENIEPFGSTINKIKELHPVKYQWKDREMAGNGYYYGFIAQQMETVFADCVYENIDGMKGINYTDLIAPLTAALQEAIAKIETLETKVAALEAGQ